MATVVVGLVLAVCLLITWPWVRDAGQEEPDWAQARRRMVHEQMAGPGREITNARVLDAMGRVPRHEFVPEALRGQAYADQPLPIGHDQTISQPYIVAFMTQALDPQPGQRILEIGTGCGYQSAVLSHLVEEIYTIEIVEPLAQQASATLQRLGYSNVCTRVGDGYVGWPEAAPFDSIIVTCAPDHVPQPLIDQLKEGGLMVIPIGDAFQELCVLQKSQGQLVQHSTLPVRFVPMTRHSGPAPT